MPVEHASYPVIGVDRHSALLHNHLIAVYGARNLCHYRLNVGQVCCSAVALRRAYGYKNRLALLHGLTQIAGEGEALAVPCQQPGQVFLEDRHAPFAQEFNPGFVIVYADYAVADLRKTCRRYKPHVAGSDHTDGNWIGHALALSPLWPLSGACHERGQS